MSKHAHLSFRLIGPATAILFLAVACGDDDDTTKNNDAGKGGGGGESAGSSSAGKGGSSGSTAAGTGGKGGAGGATGTGDLEEGEQCMTTAECGTGLTCKVASAGGVGVQICARTCTSDSDCGDETCESDTTRMTDAYCKNYNATAFTDCGPAYTAECGSALTCLLFAQSTAGVCVNVCALDPTEDAGPGVAASCPSSQNCIKDVIDNPAVGLCATQVGVDKECGLEKGILCSGTDICVPDDINSETGPEHCREDCTDTKACATGGTCTAVRTLFSYCKK
jgi:hypothetical protein